MAPPGPPYNVRPTDEDSSSPNVVPSGQLHSEQVYDESFATMDDSSIDAMSLQETGDNGASFMANIIPNQNLHPSLVTHDQGHVVQHPINTVGGAYEAIGIQSSPRVECRQFHTWTWHRRKMMETVLATDGAGIQYPIRHGLMNPRMAIYEERMRTYRRWPQGFFIRPQEAASAGLYCVEGTHVVCFACGGGLDHWEPGDDPLKEHARIYDWCPYVAAVLVKRFLRS